MNKKAFTLVELIVSITILAILGTIAFISLQSYSKNSRDSVRISDLSSIKTSLELFHIDAGKYPLTSSGYDVTYGGGKVWNQGIFGESTFKNVAKLDKIPKDPLTEKEYTYSVLNTRNEFELAGIMEGESLVFNVPHTIFSLWEKGGYILPQANAADQTVSVMVTGNYNGEMLNVTKSGITCVVAVPSIIASSGTTLEIIAQNNLFVYNNFKNLPSDYSQYTKFKLLGEPNLKLVNESNMDLYCGDYSQLNINESLRLDFIENLQNSYSGTQIEVTGRIKEVLELTIDINNPSPDLRIYTIDLIEDVFNTTISEDQKLLAGECNSTYHDEGGVCISDTREVTITNGIGTQTWNGTSWNPVVLQSCNATFHTEDNITCISNISTCSIINGTGLNTWNGTSWDCTVATCDTNYTQSGTSCVANTQTYTCAAKPATGTAWNTVSSYTQTWNGTAWTPANSTTAYNATASTTACRYKCDTNYTWNGTSCVANTQITFPSTTVQFGVGSIFLPTEFDSDWKYLNLFFGPTGFKLQYIAGYNDTIDVDVSTSYFNLQSSFSKVSLYGNWGVSYNSTTKQIIIFDYYNNQTVIDLDNHTSTGTLRFGIPTYDVSLGFRFDVNGLISTYDATGLYTSICTYSNGYKFCRRTAGWYARRYSDYINISGN